MTKKKFARDALQGANSSTLEVINKIIEIINNNLTLAVLKIRYLAAWTKLSSKNLFNVLP